jgi:hypothetical protein
VPGTSKIAVWPSSEDNWKMLLLSESAWHLRSVQIILQSTQEGKSVAPRLLHVGQWPVLAPEDYFSTIWLSREGTQIPDSLKRARPNLHTSGQPQKSWKQLFDKRPSFR